MKLDFTSVAGMIQPEGCPALIHELFSVSAEYDRRLQKASDEFVDEIGRRMKGPERPHMFCDATLVRDFTHLVDEHAKPETPNELAFTCYIMGRTIQLIRTYALSAKVQVKIQPEFQKGGIFQGNTNATA
jgi:hypothetical protein